MRGFLSKIVTLSIAIVLLPAACVPDTPDTPAVATATLQQIAIPITVEVTRVVTQQIVVQVTPTPTQPCPPPQSPSHNPVIIGAIIPLSKPGNIHAGHAMQIAFDIAVNEINNAGGVLDRPLRLITYDSAGSAEQGAMLAERLIREDCAIAITGLYHDAVAMAVAEIAHSYHVPVIAHARIDQITAAGYPEVFRILPSRSMLARMPAEWLASIGDYNGDGIPFTVLVVETNSQESEYYTFLQSALSDNSIQYVTLPVDLPTSDFSPLIARIVTLDQLPDALIISTADETALAIQAQLMKAGIGPANSTLIISNQSALDDQLFWGEVPKGTGTLVPRVGPWHSTATQIGHHFAAQYSKQTHHWPEADAFAAYDAIFLLADAMQRASTETAEALIAALETSNITLASGNYFFRYTGSTPLPADAPAYLWHQWPDPPVLLLQYTHPDQPSTDMPVVWPPLYRTIDAPVVR